MEVIPTYTSPSNWYPYQTQGTSIFGKKKEVKVVWKIISETERTVMIGCNVFRFEKPYCLIAFTFNPFNGKILDKTFQGIETIMDEGFEKIDILRSYEVIRYGNKTVDTLMAWFRKVNDREYLKALEERKIIVNPVRTAAAFSEKVKVIPKGEYHPKEYDIEVPKAPIYKNSLKCGKHHYTLVSWERRGHYRHYPKTGKTVYIKPQTVYAPGCRPK